MTETTTPVTTELEAPALGPVPPPRQLSQYRRATALLGHVALGMAAFAGAFVIRFEGDIPEFYWQMMVWTLPLAVLFKSAAVLHYRITRDLPRYVGLEDLVRILKAASAGSALLIIGVVILVGHGFPRSVFIIDFLLTIGLYSGSRLFLQLWKETFRHGGQHAPGRRTLILGAGDTGETVLRMIKKDFTGV